MMHSFVPAADQQAWHTVQSAQISDISTYLADELGGRGVALIYHVLCTSLKIIKDILLLVHAACCAPLQAILSPSPATLMDCQRSCLLPELVCKSLGRK